MTVNQRIEKIYEDLKIGQSEFARLVDIPQSRLNNQVLGKNGVGLDTVISICSKIKNLNPRWLLLGEGEMWLSENSINQISDILIQEPPPQYEGAEKEVSKKKAEAEVTEIEILKKSVELLQIEMWKMKQELEALKREKK